MTARSTMLSVAGLALVVFAVPVEAGAEEPSPSARIFDGRPKVLVVNGYSTSAQWPGSLQRKLDRQFGGKRVVAVRSAIKGGTPVARWIDVKSGARLKPWRDVLKPALRREDERPTIVLAQQSLQWVYGERSEGIRAPDDGERIRQGADALETYVRALLEDGADAVFVAMHIYKHEMEPEIGRERLALADLLKRKVPNVHAGPDVWAPTKEHDPQAFARDRKHPNRIGAELMAQKWFEALLAHDGLKVPEWSRRELAEALRSEPREPAARRRRPRPAKRPDTGDGARDDRIDWDKARRLRRSSLEGEKLSKEECEYLERAKEARRERLRDRPGPPREPGPSTGLVPLTDMAAESRYKGHEGGLYGGGRNEPPKAHLEAALREARKVQPLDAAGKPSKKGRVVLISNGMSNTTQEFQEFMRLAESDPARSSSLVVVDGAQGGMEASDWAYPEKRFRKNRPSPWDVLDRRLKQAGVTPQQVQVVWIKQARRNPASLGEFPRHAEELKDNLAVVLQKLKERFPNLRLAYVSSRIYAGYARTALNPEPYAYESAFSTRWLIRDQIKGDPALNYDPERGAVKAPLVLWGPYLWADGLKGRKTDELVWKREDLAGDGTHPTLSGRRKVAALLLAFFKSDPTARSWFLQSE